MVSSVDIGAVNVRIVEAVVVVLVSFRMRTGRTQMDEKE